LPARTMDPHGGENVLARGDGGPGVIEGAKEEMRAVAGELKTIRYRLLGVQASIPPSPQETSEGDLEGETDPATELRSLIGIGIQDHLEPLIRGLLTAAEGGG
jgi:hypothetical protein